MKKNRHLRAVSNFRELIVLAREINEGKEQIVRAASSIAGCDLSDLEFEDVEAYVDLAIEKFRK